MRRSLSMSQKMYVTILIKMVKINVVLATANDHMQITTKLENNQPREPYENYLNKSPTTKNMKKPHQDW